MLLESAQELGRGGGRGLIADAEDDYARQLHPEESQRGGEAAIKRDHGAALARGLREDVYVLEAVKPDLGEGEDIEATSAQRLNRRRGDVDVREESHAEETVSGWLSSVASRPA